MKFRWLVLIFLVANVGLVGCGRVYRIESHSMTPTYEVGKLVTITPIDLDELKRNDIVGYSNPHNTEEQYIKRLVGLPGDTVAIADGQLIVNGEPIDEPYLEEPTTGLFEELTLNDDEYFLLGDNRQNSSDSRNMGPIKAEYIIGRVTVTWWNRLTQD